MELDRSIYRTGKVFFETGGKWFIGVWVLSFLTGIVPLIVTLFRAEEFLFWVSAIGLLVGFVIMPHVAFHRLRIADDEKAFQLDDKDRRAILLVRIGELRKAGTKLRNDACRAKHKVYKEHFEEQIKAWTDETLETVGELYPSEYQRLETLDRLDVSLPSGCRVDTEDKGRVLQMLSKRIVLLEEILIAYRE